MKKALITGVTGQDGSYLAEFLLKKGYDVHGIIRRSSVDYRERTAHLEGRRDFHLHYGDLSDSMSILAVISASARPDCRKPAGFIRRLLLNCTEKWKKFHRMKKRRFTRTVPMPRQSRMGFGLPENTGKLIICSAAPVFYCVTAKIKSPALQGGR